MFKNIFLAIIIFSLASCAKEPLPKPSGELRLEYPAHKYQTLVQNSPFSFEYSTSAKIFNGKKTFWYYVNYPNMKAKIFITYFPIKNDFNEHLKEAEKLVYEHTIKASSIDTKTFSYPEKKVYGNFYELNGESASNIQFYVTDSTRNFVTANLYFNSRPRPDSLAPAVDYIKKDMLHMIETFKWK
ncbi:gliding motility lipoprotein GldD [Halpernia frigidisoli]|uniref:Protein involved in gliding motility GldD n=1 Tax=Halpernia frigidisoli TaxID=1125876 RepID=A0A1I3IST8_9FLAO|nr:gliding motility lipoprotein GldD [Halpernia frigidisoli]SFI51021.1 protein involved in gliding motility GldD [Halpernia frigidisoli]